MSWNPFARGKREERPVVAPVSREEVDGRAGALQRALTLGGAALPADDVAVARKLLARVAERSRLGGDHTVVALAGATGSGKSSLFNLLVGEPVSRIGARRPTTSRASAAEGSGRSSRRGRSGSGSSSLPGSRPASGTVSCSRRRRSAASSVGWAPASSALARVASR